MLGGFDPCAGRTTREEGVETKPRIVGDRFRELLWESGDGELDRVFILRKGRPNVLIEGGFLT